MNIAATQYSLATNSFEIYLSGCNGNCKGCHNSELKNFNLGVPFRGELPKLHQKIIDFDEIIKWIWILGGEPLDQNHDELRELLSFLSDHDKPIVLFTRYSLKDVPKSIKEYCDYIKTGTYLEEEKIDNYSMYGITLATKNQYVHRLDHK